MRLRKSDRPLRGLLRCLASITLGILGFAFGIGAAHAGGAPLAELHVYAGSQEGNSGEIGLRAAEAAFWPTSHDRVAVRYDNSLSQDNAQLARLGINAEAYFLSYLHDFDGRVLLFGEVGTRSLPTGQDQSIYKSEGVFLKNNRAAKIGLQLSDTRANLTSYNDTLVYALYNLPAGQHWRLEPQVYLSQSGTNKDREWRAAGYAEYNAAKKWQLGVGAGYGEVDSTLPGVSGEVFNVHAQVSLPIRNHRVHFQVRHEEAPTSRFTVGLIGVSLRFDRK